MKRARITKNNKNNSTCLSFIVLLDKDILNCILVPYLSVMDLISLSKAIPALKGSLSQSIYGISLEKIIEYLADLIDPVFLRNLLQSNIFSLTGSSLLAAITNADWKDDIGDIDLVFIQENIPPNLCGNTVVRGDIVHHGPSHPNLFPFLPIGVVDKYTYKELPCRNTHRISYGTNDALQSVVDYVGITNSKSRKNVKLQLLSVTSIEDYLDNYDLNFCKVTLSNNELKIYDSNSVIQKECAFDVNYYYIDTIEHEDYLVNIYMPSRLMRLKKYADRGFTITTNINTLICEKDKDKEWERGIWNRYWYDHVVYYGKVPTSIERPEEYNRFNKVKEKCHKNT